MNTQKLWQEMHLQELLDKLQKLFPSATFSTESILELLLAGDFYGALGEVAKGFLNLLTIDVPALRRIMVSLLLMSVLGAFFVQFADLIEKYRISEICFYFIYLAQALILARCYAYCLEISKMVMQSIYAFIRMMMPLYLLAVSVATGTLTAGAGCQFLLLLLYGVEKLFQMFFLPVLSIFFLISLLEGLDGADRWNLIMELIKKGVETALKVLLGGVAALGFMQSLLTPALDAIKGTAFQRLIQAIPGLGNSAEGVLSLAAASAIVIKNSVGVLLLFLLLLLSAMPLLKLVTLTLTFRISAAVMGIIGDKRLTKAVDRMGECGMLLLLVTGCATLLFWLAIALTTVPLRYP